METLPKDTPEVKPPGNENSVCSCDYCKSLKTRLRSSRRPEQICARCDTAIPDEALDCPYCGAPRWDKPEEGYDETFDPYTLLGGTLKRFGQPFAEIVENPHLPAMARLIYVIITCSAHEGIAELSVSLIAQRAGVAKRNARRHLQILEEAHFIKRLSTGTRRARWAVRPTGDPTDPSFRIPRAHIHKHTENRKPSPREKGTPAPAGQLNLRTFTTISGGEERTI